MREKTNKNNEQDYFNQLVREKMENHRLPVDDNCWTEIERALVSNRRKIPLWVWVPTAVAASLALLLLLRIPFGENAIDKNTTTEWTDNFNKENNQSSTEQAIVISPEEKQTVSSEKNRIPISEKKTNPIAEKIPEVQTEDAIALQETEKETEFVPDKSKKNTLGKSTVDFNSGYKWNENATNRKGKKNEWLIAASFGSGSRRSLGDNAAYGKNNDLVPDFSGVRPEGDLSSSEKIDEIFFPDEFSDVTHYTPLSFSINIRKNIDKHWAVESGLTYTYLLSKFKRTDPIPSEATMKMHYIGIPLNLVGYIVNNNPKWNLYVSAGGMIEKGIQLDFTRNRYYNGYTTETKLKDNIPGWQYSLNTSLGIDYKIYKDMSFFVEPRITYYLNNNQPESIRTKNPFIVGFNTGLRLGF